MNKNLVHIFMAFFTFMALFIIRAMDLKRAINIRTRILFIFMALSIIRAMNVKRAINTWTRILFIYSYLFSHSLLYYFTFDKYEATQETYDLLPVTMTNTVTVTCNIWNNLCRSRTQGLPRNFQFVRKLSSVSGNFLTVWKLLDCLVVSGLSGNCLDFLETFQIVLILSKQMIVNTCKNFMEVQKISDWQRRCANNFFGTLRVIFWDQYKGPL